MIFVSKRKKMRVSWPKRYVVRYSCSFFITVVDFFYCI
jgi:hypothetical protein